MTTIIQNAIYVPETKTYHMAPSEGSIDIDFGAGLVLTLGGGLDCAWREPIEVNAKLVYGGRYEEMLLTSEDSMEVIHEKLLWPDGPDKTTGTLLKDFHYLTLAALMEADILQTFPTRLIETILYWHAQKEPKHLGN